MSALLVVQKPQGQGVRICVDPKFLNKALKRSTYYMQTDDELYAATAECGLAVCVVCGLHADVGGA